MIFPNQINSHMTSDDPRTKETQALAYIATQLLLGEKLK